MSDGKGTSRFGRRMNKEFYNSRYGMDRKRAQRMRSDMENDFRKTYARHIQLAEKRP